MDTILRHNIVLLLLRVVFGGSMIIGHGWPKLQKLMAGGEIKFMDFMGLGPEISLALVVFSEGLCSLLLVLGLFTRWATIPLIFTMLVAILKVNWGAPFVEWEKGFLFLAAYVCLFIAGAGRYSIDYRLGNPNKL